MRHHLGTFHRDKIIVRPARLRLGASVARFAATRQLDRVYGSDSAFQEHAEAPAVWFRTDHKPAAPMHLKSYQIDGRLLRTGAANFSASGLKRQDNDLIAISARRSAKCSWPRCAAFSACHPLDARLWL